MLRIVPIFQDEAFEFIKKHHRHHRKPVGTVFQIACAAEYEACSVKTRKEIKVYEIIGVATAGRPNGRFSQDGFTLEVTRLCTDGTRNACSMLYAACWRTARAMGYLKLYTYILNSEPGTSLYAAGARLIGERGGGSWSVPSRPRVDKHPLQRKLLFEFS